jgi:DNA-binding NarL/FixJ family response regulator
MAWRLLIVDDDPRFRELFRQLVEDRAEFEVVGEASDGNAATAAARELEPDVILLDVNLPDAFGFDLVPELIGDGNGPAVVMTSSRDDDAYEGLAREAGAAGFVSKHDLSAAAIQRLLGDHR